MTQRRAAKAGRRRTWVIIILLLAINIPATYAFARMREWHPRRVITGASSDLVVNHKASIRDQKAPTQLTSSHYVGVAIDAPFTARLNAFKKVLGEQPGIVEYYMSFGTNFPTTRAVALAKQHSLSLIQINPRHVRLADIAAGKYDTYLRSYAAAARRFRAPVAICFGHEMNGPWYPWGRKYTRPATFVAAWKHIHNVFAAERASNVIWVWAVSRDANRGGWRGLRRWWPGPRYVNWVGIDGYYRTPSQTFAYVFSQVLAELHKFTTKPEIIDETAVGPFRDRNRKIRDLVAGVARNHLLGLVWFDINAMERWAIDRDRAAGPLLRLAMSKYRAAALAGRQTAPN